MRGYSFPPWTAAVAHPIAQRKTTMSALNIIDRFASPVVTTLLLAALPLAFVGFFIQGF